MPTVALKVVPKYFTFLLAATAYSGNAKGVLAPNLQGTPWSVS